MPLRTTSPYVSIATVEKTQGLHGELVIRYDTRLPFVLSEGNEVWFLPPSIKGPNNALLLSHDDGYPCSRVRFEGIDSIQAASELVGRKVLVRRSDAATDGLGFDPDEFIGRSVVCCDHGPLGLIEEIIQTPANAIWCVQGPFGEVLIPVIDQVVMDEPADVAEPIQVKLIKGLIDPRMLED